MIVFDILFLNDLYYVQMYLVVLDINCFGQVYVISFGDWIINVKFKIDVKFEEIFELVVMFFDGCKVFMDKNGDVYMQDNELVDLVIVEGIDWEGCFNYEVYFFLIWD